MKEANSIKSIRFQNLVGNRPKKFLNLELGTGPSIPVPNSKFRNFLGHFKFRKAKKENTNKDINVILFRRKIGKNFDNSIERFRPRSQRDKVLTGLARWFLFGCKTHRYVHLYRFFKSKYSAYSNENFYLDLLGIQVEMFKKLAIPIAWAARKMYYLRYPILIIFILDKLLDMPYSEDDVDLTLYFNIVGVPSDRESIECDIKRRIQEIVMVNDFVMKLKRDLSPEEFKRVEWGCETPVDRQGIKVDIFDRIKQHFKAKKPDVSLKDRLIEDLKADSLDLVELFMDIEYSYGLSIPTHRANVMSSGEEIVDLVYELVHNKINKHYPEDVVKQNESELELIKTEFKRDNQKDKIKSMKNYLEIEFLEILKNFEDEFYSLKDYNFKDKSYIKEQIKKCRIQQETLMDLNDHLKWMVKNEFDDGRHRYWNPYINQINMYINKMDEIVEDLQTNYL
uniref:Acyl carrier protein n=1 Tax=Olisthodiscus luteus TaxID=83000 RepID=A0A7U0KSM8_OLILU|nr:acyl carrier protein [Olisthodiscus luteus]YP_010152833.1 acyl carrier protein [Olisthodiscus luteus]QQW50458.1 acyl carrier protein [Olisthodiscus luteus]QQW50494.1 acyl carrier protein [Olisthodiscus luteus]